MGESERGQGLEFIRKSKLIKKLKKPKNENSNMMVPNFW